MQDLELWFNKARLPIKVEQNSINNSNIASTNDIFQMSIETKGKKKGIEYFKLSKGHENNQVRVIDVDCKARQLILLVKEPERQYKVRRWDYIKRDYVEEMQKTPNNLRKLLCGFDEKHLFIAQLPDNQRVVNKIKDAHRILKPQIIAKNKKKNNRIKRQGEWFFIPITHKEQELINLYQKNVLKKVRIGNGGGNPHIANQLLRIKDNTFVKGKISHIEHKTLKMPGWFKVIKNLESTRSSGIKWID